MSEHRSTPPVTEAERRARLLLAAAVEPGDPDLAPLVREHGAEAVLDRITTGRSGGKVESWRTRLAGVEADRLTDLAAGVGARFVCHGDVDWPSALDDLVRLESAGSPRRSSCPVGIWLRGQVRASAHTVAVVGARQCSSYGAQVTERLVDELVGRGLSIVSGGAYGIDAVAHTGALARGAHTVAVMAGGIDKAYPTRNATLIERVAEVGAVLSEAPPGAAPTRSRFLVRNRLIAGLASGTVVVEAALRSGALNTLRWALHLDRGAMVVPGSVLAVTSAGTNQALRTPGVLAVTRADEVVEHVAPIGTCLAEEPRGPRTSRDRLTAWEQEVLDAFPAYEAVGVQALGERCGSTERELARVLAVLLAEGLVEPVGDRFRVTQAART